MPGAMQTFDVALLYSNLNTLLDWGNVSIYRTIQAIIEFAAMISKHSICYDFIGKSSISCEDV